jgi:hypothetical protein
MEFEVDKCRIARILAKESHIQAKNSTIFKDRPEKIGILGFLSVQFCAEQ